MSSSAGKCPFLHSSNGRTNSDWWPEQLNLKVLNQNSELTSPMPQGFHYASEFRKLGNLRAIKTDLTRLMTDSQEWWPADYGHYGPFFIRLAWHAAGTYRIHDGRGGSGSGQQRFAPLNSWPDNGNLDKARRLLLPIKQKYGKKISWGDLYILAGNVALESMGFQTFGFGGGREDVFEPEDDVNWGQESTWLTDDERYDKKHRQRTLGKPLGAVEMGLIYVNPTGPGGNPDPLASAKDIRETFGRMAMNDEETVALIAGGHTFGKCHGAGDPSANVGVEPEGAPLEEQGFGWKNTLGNGKGKSTITSGLEGAWTYNPTKWDNDYFNILFGYEWELFKSPAGAPQWRPKGGAGSGKVPDAHDRRLKHQPIMLTSDLALRMDPEYEKISRRFHENPSEFSLAFAKAWYKLCHRDMGPHSLLLGPEVPPVQLWQDPVPNITGRLVDDETELNKLKAMISNSGLSPGRLVATAWASASTYRKSDKRGGANGARICLEPQKKWEVNEPKELKKTLKKLEEIQARFKKISTFSSEISMADLIVLAGCVGVESAARAAGFETTVPFSVGRTDATQEMTDVDSFAVLEPVADGFRNYIRSGFEGLKAEAMLVDRACLLGLTAPELTVLIGGLRVLGIGATSTSAMTDNVGKLTNDFFVNLLDMGTVWSKVGDNLFHGKDRASGSLKWKATSVDLAFGSNSVLRAIAEEYSCDDAKEAFVKDFALAFAKVMNASGTSVVEKVQVQQQMQVWS
mmetsp:Transcript_30834/g.46777  ORF Transcript_30834/g.46777 Transcript_30834/m.46777 type:complete len:743 (+) Transcript_30834:92-2320(+)